MKVAYFAGLDLGKCQDHTAIGVIEWRAGRGLRLRYLERLPLGTPYTEVVERVRRAMRSRNLKGERYLVVDATGVGRAVVELLKKADLGCRVWPVLITAAGAAAARRGVFRVSKRELIVGLQGLLERGELQIAATLGSGAPRGASGTSRERDAFSQPVERLQGLDLDNLIHQGGHPATCGRTVADGRTAQVSGVAGQLDERVLSAPVASLPVSPGSGKLQ